ncbi:MAG: hypothetical protein HRT72_03720 [Flavobacteriales bacterium]|nr:hypothetical protein [Flavobacteriales bacterium]
MLIKLLKLTSFLFFALCICLSSCKKEEENAGDVTLVESIEPTCSDGLKNQDETGPDCGGICGECVADCDPAYNSIELNGAFYASYTSTNCYDSTSVTDSTSIDYYDMYALGASLQTQIRFKIKPSESRTYRTVTYLDWSISEDEVLIVCNGDFGTGYYPLGEQDLYITLIGDSLEVMFCGMLFNPDTTTQTNLPISTRFICE